MGLAWNLTTIYNYFHGQMNSKFEIIIFKINFQKKISYDLPAQCLHFKTQINIFYVWSKQKNNVADSS